jgi:hypothetical protein
MILVKGLAARISDLALSGPTASVCQVVYFVNIAFISLPFSAFISQSNPEKLNADILPLPCFEIR